MRRTPVCLLATVLALAGCSDDDSDDAAAPESTTTTSGDPVPSTGTGSPAPRSTAVTVTATAVAGWWDGGAWVVADGKKPVPVSGGETYSIVLLDQPLTTGVGSPAQEGCETNPGTSRIEVTGVERQDTAEPIAVTGVAELRPRPVAVLNPSAEAYRQAAGAYLTRRGVDDADADVAQVIRADLDGDGQDEVVVVAERIADQEGLYAAPGDYSVVLLRRVVDDAAVTTLVTETIAEGHQAEGSFVQSHRVSAVADLNGDGRMEVALAARYYEGAGTTVHELQADGSMPVVMQGGCGA